MEDKENDVEEEEEEEEEEGQLYTSCKICGGLTRSDLISNDVCDFCKERGC